MNEQHGSGSASSKGSEDTAELLRQYGCGPVPLAGTDAAFYERHLTFDQVLDPAAASPRERFEAFARSLRDILSHWNVQPCPING